MCLWMMRKPEEDLRSPVTTVAGSVKQSCQALRYNHGYSARALSHGAFSPAWGYSFSLISLLTSGLVIWHSLASGMWMDKGYSSLRSFKIYCSFQEVFQEGTFHMWLPPRHIPEHRALHIQHSIDSWECRMNLCYHSETMRLVSSAQCLIIAEAGNLDS